MPVVFALGQSIGTGNTATGWDALVFNSTGDNNTAIGVGAMTNSATGSNNIAIGPYSGNQITTTSNNIEIGNLGTSTDSGTIRIGTPGTQTSAFIAGVYAVNTSGIPVYVNSNGQLGTVSSSRRYKEDIADMGDTSSGLLRLRPVTFRYKKAFDDGSKPVQYGLIAEEVAEVYPDLVARSADGQVETVKYQLLDPMLLNELQMQHATIASLKAEIAAQEQQNRSLEERLGRIEAIVGKTTVTTSSR
jgi:hypothetical protein